MLARIILRPYRSLQISRPRPRTAVPTASRYLSSFPSNPFDIGSTASSDTKDLKEFLENDPNLEGFFEADANKDDLESTKSTEADAGVSDPFDFSELQSSPLDESDIIQQQLQQQAASSSPHPGILESTEPAVLPESFDLGRFNTFTTFYNHNELIPDALHPMPQLDLPGLVKLNQPLVILSKFHDPRLNLSIEKYIYDNVPNISTGGKEKKEPIPKRLITYINNSAIVIGKNQNPYKEINLHLASILQVPILRRYSGGGTVVHDLGNVNFSFINDKSEFDRTNFSSAMIDLLNDWAIGNSSEFNDEFKFKLPLFALGTNPKGDIINAENLKKISGSAYQLSRGRSLHHGTMLLDSNLSNLSKLLKLPNDHKESILDKSTDSIPSKVQNYDVSTEVFLFACIEAFNNKVTNGNHATEFKMHDNLLKTDPNSSVIIKLDNYNDLPAEVWETYEQLSSWSWTFAKTPKFSKKFEWHGTEFTFIVNKGLVQEVVIGDETNEKLSALKELLEKSPTLYKGASVHDQVSGLDTQLAQYLAFNIDFNFNYELLKIKD